MSHFSTIKTKLEDRDALLQALERIGERPNVPFQGTSVIELVLLNPTHAEEHPTVEFKVTFEFDVDFKFNEITVSYH